MTETRNYFSVIDFISELKTTCKIDGEFDISILMEKSPIMRKYDWCCKVLAVIFGNNNQKIYNMNFKKMIYNMLSSKKLQEGKWGIVIIHGS